MEFSCNFFKVLCLKHLFISFLIKFGLIDYGMCIALFILAALCATLERRNEVDNLGIKPDGAYASAAVSGLYINIDLKFFFILRLSCSSLHCCF
jgi:hypothetical protein